MSDDTKKLLEGLNEEEQQAAFQALTELTSEANLTRVIGDAAQTVRNKREAELLADYQREMLENRGVPHKIRAVREKYRALGLKVDNIVWNI